CTEREQLSEVGAARAMRDAAVETEAERRWHPLTPNARLCAHAARIDCERARKILAVARPYAKAVATWLAPLLRGAIKSRIQVAGLGLLRADVEKARVALVVAGRVVQMPGDDDPRPVVAGRGSHRVVLLPTLAAERKREEGARAIARNE